MTRRERGFLATLVAVVAAVGGFVGYRQFAGALAGERCADSYSCRGFLLGGVECVDTGEPDSPYCTRYCDTDVDCTGAWTCLGANPTVLAVETTAIDHVCVRSGTAR